MLIRSDFKLRIPEPELNGLTSGDDNQIRIAVIAAVEEAKGILANRYDTEKIFAEIPVWDKDTPFLEGQHCERRGKIYEAISDNMDLAPEISGAWKQEDSRNQLLVLYLLDLVIYHLVLSKAPNMIPETRLLARDNALKWMRDAANNKSSPNLPEPIAPENSAESKAPIFWGGPAPRSHRY